jgi:hypothetical protein
MTIEKVRISRRQFVIGAATAGAGLSLGITASPR